MKKIGAVLVVLMLVTMFIPKFCYAEGEEGFNAYADNEMSISNEQVEKVVNDATNTVNNVALKVAEVVSMVSLPIGLLLILWGSVLYFIMGVRNLYKKRQGMLLMWGSATFIVIAKFIHLIVFLITLKF